MTRGFKIGMTAAGLTLLVGSGAIQLAVAAQDRISMRTSAPPVSISDLRLAEPLTMQADRSTIDPALRSATGRQQVLVRLRTPSVSGSKGKSPAAQQSHR